MSAPTLGAETPPPVAAAIGRALDRRIWDSMSRDQVIAAQEIVAAVDIIVNGLGARISAYGDGGRGHGAEYESEKSVRLQSLYRRWIQRCRGQDIDFQAAVDILVDGKSITAVAAARRVRKDRPRVELFRALDVWCSIRWGDS